MVQGGNTESAKALKTGIDMVTGKACIVFSVGISTYSACKFTLATKNCQKMHLIVPSQQKQPMSRSCTLHSNTSVLVMNQHHST